MSQLNEPAHSLEAEQTIIASILQYGKTEQAIRECIDTVTPEMFYFASNREIYEVCKSLEVVDYGLVIDQLKRNAKAQNEVFDYEAVVKFKRAYSTHRNLKPYINLIVETHTQRQLASIAYEITQLSCNKVKPVEIVDYIHKQLSDLDVSTNYELRNMQDALMNYFPVLQERSNPQKSATGIKTGIDDLDRQIIGLGKSWLFVLAGRPSHGKSLIAQLIGNHISRTAPTFFISMEMEEAEVCDRLMGLEGGIAPSSLRSGLLTDIEFSRVSEITKDVKSRRINQYIDTTPNLSLQQIRARCLKFKKTHPNGGLIQIDYLGLMKKGNYERNDLAIAELTTGLKSLAKEIQIPIMLLVQLNRAADTARRLTMSNLADSASIERDADLVLFAHREEVANPDTENKGVIELIAGKFRHDSQIEDVYLKKIDGRFQCIAKSEIARAQAKNTKGFDL